MGNSVDVGSVAEFQEIIGTGEPILVEFHAGWCGPCQALSPNVERVAAAHVGRLRVLKVNIESAPELAERSEVREIPALHFYRDGRKVAALTGFRTEEALTRELSRYGLIAQTAAAAKPAGAPVAGQGTSWAARLIGSMASLGRREAGPARTASDSTSFRFIESEEELAAVIDGSFHRSTAIFLHDPWCPVSARAFREMEQLGIELPAIDVSRSRHLNSAVERRTGVRHASPQVVVLRDAAVVWDGSHRRITAAAVRSALGEPSPGEAVPGS